MTKSAQTATSRGSHRRTADGTSSLFAAGGEAGAILARLDWRGRSIGVPERWPQSLRTALGLCLASRHPICILWGTDYTYLYNDAYTPIVGSKHPWALGAPYPEVWPEIWESDIKPVLEGVMATGVASWADNLLLVLQRYGFSEECYFSFSFAPIRDERGEVGGVFTAITETTPQVVGERRLRTLSELGARTSETSSVEEAVAATVKVLAENPYDIPLALIYLLQRDDRHATLAGQVGMPPAGPEPPPRIDPVRDREWGFEQALASGEPLQLVRLPGVLSRLPAHPWPERVEHAIVLPVALSGQPGLHGFLVCGLSPRRPYDSEYRNFLVLIGNQLATAIGAAHAYEDERRRAEALAALDRAKTAFFSNVSHEFRTPLTLILGALRDVLEDAERLAPEHRDRLETARRNSLRLLKLVNTLLDFARIEAGRVQAAYEPTDLAAATADLVSCFRSAIEKAGLRLIVDCPPLPEPIYVDREMWEKIVLNLVSNAFKFTLEGEIEVRLTLREHDVQLSVRDTGAGIASDQLRHVFERFHRIETTQGRTHEGTGIGLALVEELVRLHGGRIGVESEEGRGTIFTVSIPRGKEHLPRDRIGDVRALSPAALRAESFLVEALGWLPDDAAQAVRAEPAPQRLLQAATEPAGRILVADDNADMRDYLRRLLAPRYRVETAANAAEALAAIRRSPPDLLLSDVMMPGMDGFALLGALRGEAATLELPVVLLSARAGEESRIEALAAGADDYLVKPFSARELLTRVEHYTLRGRLRAAEREHARQLSRIFEHAPAGIAVLRGPTHVFEFANRPYLELVGQRDVVGKPVREALPELTDQGLYELLERVFQSGEPFVGRSWRADIARGHEPVTEERYFDFVYQPMPGEDGTTDAIVVVVFEVTELARTKREAEAASRAKDEFLAMLGHELRNPLAPILTALQLLRLRGVEEASRERDIIERQVRHLASLVDDLLDVSRLTRGKVALRKEHALVGDIVARALEQASPLLEQQRHRLDVDVPAGELWVHVDVRRMSQVVANLLTNAAKYTEPGGHIAVCARAEGGEAVLRVRDNGMGIPADLLPQIFDLFYQEGQSPERSRGGLGLGLTIVRRFVELHGGSVTAASAGRGCGSEFSVRLPLAASTRATPHPARRRIRSARATGARVLIVDDNADAADMLAESLATFGYVTRTAHDGPSALAAAAQFLPQIALLDIGLPAMDGYELGQRLRDASAQPIHLCALTGYGNPHDRERSTTVGFSAHFTKPVDLDALDAALRQLLLDPAPGAPTH